MALTTEQIGAAKAVVFRECGADLRSELAEVFASAIEAEVRKQDDALIQQLVDLLDEATAYTSSPAWSPSMTEECKAGITAARARLGEKT